MPWRIRYKDRALEWHVAFATLAFGIGVASPEFILSKSLDWMHRVMGEVAWGYVFAAIGAVHLLALAINGARWWTPLARTVMAALNLAAYSFLTIGFWVDAPTSTGVLTYGFFMVPCLGTTLFRAARDAFWQNQQPNINEYLPMVENGLSDQP
ncbi:hypothetical protein ACRARG_12520 [Pseudooceanicola sp. C21-150M6]|uniref:hypothetical protein n=1 Tax=Pseudooceanicola sp. C21-150M6 TaxID=3434355 RepID=UPI003D7FF7C4